MINLCATFELITEYSIKHFLPFSQSLPLPFTHSHEKNEFVLKSQFVYSGERVARKLTKSVERKLSLTDSSGAKFPFRSLKFTLIA